MKATLDAHIEQTPGILGGKPRIAGHRIAVEHVVTWHLQLGQSVDAIAIEYGLSHASIHAALAYYYDHREEMDTKMAADAAWVEQQRKNAPSLVRERLSERGHDGGGA